MTLDDEKDASHWIGIAISLAETTCMSSVLGTATTSDQKLWKRIWWSCYTRDCLVSLGLRQPAKIESAKFNVPMLEQGDFDIRVLPDTAILNSAQCTLLGNIEMQSQLAALFVAKAKLCLSIRRLLATQYSAKFRAGMTGCSTTKSAMMLSPMASSLTSVSSIDKALKDWEESLPSCCQSRTPSPSEDERPAIVLHRALLHMLYHAAIVALHRPSCQPFLRVGIERQTYSHSRVSEAAMRISHLAAMLSSIGLDRFLPTASVTAIMLAVISHISAAKQKLSREGRAQVNRDIMRRTLGKTQARDQLGTGEAPEWHRWRKAETRIRGLGNQLYDDGHPTLDPAASSLRSSLSSLGI
ncbi:hypothetical protein EDB80DRAFT_816672 [Ilyonectria destructans]|nr:hypothetical protein EDB80DRAFT_816672 [Ilyonectria destructans]